ncbi:MAG: hypothetical protein JOY68_09690, partial [Candidatus Dormibacteraeota bacterium]|nr:hypothetical protein [Candidatus Dormibacteraeota bacterium]
VEVLDREEAASVVATPIDDVAPEVEPPVPAALIAEQRSPHTDVSSMSLDARELVAGLLDRWERTLEQRIYAEQRQRFEAELNARQNLVKQLQLELQAVRAENAASLADRDRRIADGDRTVVQLQRDLAEAREVASRRRWFFRH